MDGLKAHSDIVSEGKGERGEATEATIKGRSVIVELNDTVNDKTSRYYRLENLLLILDSYYYIMPALVMTAIEKGIISIRYDSRE